MQSIQLVEQQPNHPLRQLQQRLLPLHEQDFAKEPLTKQEAETAIDQIMDSVTKKYVDGFDFEFQGAKERHDKMGKIFAFGGTKVYVHVTGDVPEGGRTLLMSLHGGGGPSPQTAEITKSNFGDWQVHHHIFKPKDFQGVFIAPLTPSSAWNQWHLPHMDQFFDRLLKVCFATYSVSPDKVILIGYSAGGDGLYRLAGRLADRWACAGAFAGHPGDGQIKNLKNLPFVIMAGGNDTAYGRNERAQEWQIKLEGLQVQSQSHQGGLHEGKYYTHRARIVEGKGHNVVKECIEMLPWMCQQQRNPYPDQITWIQHSPIHHRFYWISLPNEMKVATGMSVEVHANFESNLINIVQCDYPQLTLNFNDNMGIDLDKPITVIHPNELVEMLGVQRTIATISRTAEKYADRSLTFSAQLIIEVNMKQSEKEIENFIEGKLMMQRGNTLEDSVMMQNEQQKYKQDKQEIYHFDSNEEYQKKKEEFEKSINKQKLERQKSVEEIEEEQELWQRFLRDKKYQEEKEVLDQQVMKQQQEGHVVKSLEQTMEEQLKEREVSQEVGEMVDMAMKEMKQEEEKDKG